MQDLISDTDLPPNAVARLVLAGARSVGLATQVLAFIEDFRRSQPEMAPHLEALSRHVIRDWGLDMGTRAPAPPTPPEPELRWPPQPATLDSRYTENYFHVRQTLMGTARAEGDDELSLLPEHKLRYTDRCEWNETARGWWMRFAHGELTTWVMSKDVRCGDEIPEGERVVGESF